MLPYLLKKRFRRSQPESEKLIGGSASDRLDHHMIGELMDAAHSHDVKGFRSALTALVYNLFEDQENDGRKD